jgi:hypothetical protein
MRVPMIVELRNYRVEPTRRQEFIDHFERQFVHTQEAVGIGVLGQFTVVGASDRFVWLRTFTDMASRRDVLQRFYGGPVWQRHGPLANEIMTESDDVLLLRPSATSPDLAAGYRPDPSTPPDPRRAHDGVVLAAITTLAGHADDVEPRLAAALERAARDLNLRELGRMVVEPSPNDFPRLPVRQEPGTFVWLVGAPRPADATLDRALGDTVSAPVRTLVLEPTARSFLPAATGQ